MESCLDIPADGLLTMPITLAVPLDLPDVRVLAHRMLEKGTVWIEVESTLHTTQGHRCGRDIDRFHGCDRPIRLRHLPGVRASGGGRNSAEALPLPVPRGGTDHHPAPRLA